MLQPGPLMLFGSGEVAPSARRAWDGVLTKQSARLRIVIMETPAGFQPNSRAVAQNIADYLADRFPDRRLHIEIIPARRREHANDPQVVRPLASADLVFMGPGSPTYAVRHLRDTFAWRIVRYRWQHQGMGLVLASAAVLAVARLTLPVYEIFKVGEDLHWQPGLGLLPWVVVPHWDNREGGATLDTRYCFMGAERFERLRRLLPADATILGIEEHTAFLWDPAAGRAEVIGKGAVHWWRGQARDSWSSGETHPLQVRLPEVALLERERAWLSEAAEAVQPPDEVMALVREREAARRAKDWTRADALREQVLQAGWQIMDTPDGPQLRPL